MIVIYCDLKLDMADFKITAVGKFGCLGNSCGAEPAKLHRLSRACRSDVAREFEFMSFARRDSYFMFDG